ncbi:hypothetical protein CWI79_05935 [Pseudidiomarina salinarum]|nr:hypothetical protein CWI79_05935 [Pseudidiomarina salinarum]
MLLMGCSTLSTPSAVTLVDGVYWSHRYQAYLDVQDQIATRYQWTPASCNKAAAGLLPKVMTPATAAGQHDWVYADYQSIRLQRRSDGLPVVFIRSPFLPGNCQVSAVETAQTNLDALTFSLAQFGHPVPYSQLLRWRYEAGRLDTELHDSPLAESLALFQLLTAVLDQGGDEHAFLLSRELQNYHSVSTFAVGEAQRARARFDLLQQLSSSRLASSCERKIWWGLLQDNRYYLGVLSLQELSDQPNYDAADQRCLAQALDAIAADMRKAGQLLGQPPELLIDLRYNEGGSMLLASQLADSIAYKEQPLAIIGEHAIKASPRAADLSGLYQDGTVLVTEVTASAAEHLAQALRLRGLTLSGQTTRGAFSPITVRTLPNGWIIGLSMYSADQVRDGANNPLPEKKGLTPEVPLPLDVLFPAATIGEP